MTSTVTNSRPESVTNPRATLIERVASKFPARLILLRQWVIWKLVERGGRMTKIPHQSNGKMADSTDPKTWSDFDAVCAAYLSDEGFTGIGFVFSADDPYVGIDLDKCRNTETGEVETWALNILRDISTYTELSPSGKGFHLIGEGKLPPKGRKKNQIEMYDFGRYFTVTGDHYDDCDADVEDIQDSLVELHSSVFGGGLTPAQLVKQYAANDIFIAAPATPVQPQAVDQTVIDAILASDDAATFRQFQAGNWTALGYPSQSEGDLALTGMLARHVGPHPGQIDRLFRATGMMRDKWDEQRGVNTYGELTIAKALEDASENNPMSQFIGQMNQRFAVIKNGNQVRILEEMTGDTDFRLYSRSDFDLVSTNLPFPGKAKSAAATWLRHPQRREFDRVVFAPGQEMPGSYNLWRGFSVKRKPGCCDLYWQLIQNAICADSPDLYQYVRRYLAHMAQKPWERPEVALVLRGGQGTGKNTFVNTAGALAAKHFCEVSSVDQLTGRFNAHLRSVLVLHANEATWGGNKNESGKLKALITDPTIPIEMKGVDIFHVDNFLRIVISSNNAWPVPIEADDRRFLALDVRPDYKQDTKFFSALHAQLNSGGREALMHDLMTEDITEFSPRNKPASPFGADMKIRSADTPTRWLFECLNCNAYSQPMSGLDHSTAIFSSSGASATVAKDSLFSSYQYWCKSSPDRFSVGQAQLFKRLRELLGSSVANVRPAAAQGGFRERVLVLSGLEACRSAFEVGAGVVGMVTWDAV